MQGHYEVIGERPTYFPPFVNEKFGRSPYWACTFASLLNGANVGYRGAKPATPGEIKALAHASGDTTLRGGSRSSHMVVAMRARYGQQMRIRSLPPERVQARLGHGWAMVAGITYQELPARYQTWSRTFKGGHRVLLIGWDGDRTRLVDPMDDGNHDYAGRWIRWHAFEQAWWSREQLWFRDGMFLPQPTITSARLLPAPRPWSAKRGATLDLLSPRRPSVVVRRVQGGTEGDAAFDAMVGRVPPPPSTAPPTPLIRISAGPYRGLLLDPGTEGLRIDLAGIPEVKRGAAAPSHPGTGLGQGKGGGDSADSPQELRGRREEWDRIHAFVGPTVVLPDRP